MIKLSNATFGYGKTPVQKNISLEFEEGEVLMITGPNGTGKSTLLKVLAGILHPSAGTVEYGWEGVKDPREYIGYLPDSLSIYRSMKVRDICRLHWDAFGVEPSPLPLLDRAKIPQGERVENLSTGQHALFQLSLVMSTKPRLLLVDEILHSVDPYLRSLALESIVERIADEGPAVVMVNLNYSEIEHLVSRVIFLSGRGITLNEPVEDLVQSRGKPLPEILQELMEGCYTGGGNA